MNRKHFGNKRSAPPRTGAAPSPREPAPRAPGNRRGAPPGTGAARPREPAPRASGNRRRAPPGNRRRAPPGNRRRAPMVVTGRVSLVLPTLQHYPFRLEAILNTSHHCCCVNVTAERSPRAERQATIACLRGWSRPSAQLATSTHISALAEQPRLATHEACRSLRYDDTRSSFEVPHLASCHQRDCLQRRPTWARHHLQVPSVYESHQELRASRCVSCADPCTNDTGTLGDVLLVWLPVWNHAE